MQTAIFYVFMRDESEQRVFIPYRMGEMTFFRKCSDGEVVTVEGRLKDQNEQGLTWDARAMDENGRTLMHVRDMMMRWFSA